ncbi:MAG: sulfatase [Planctomycetales bacterium]|nr:sulfatase [Planctomycetales bacterium]
MCLRDSAQFPRALRLPHFIASLMFVIAVTVATKVRAESAERPPNVVIVFADDLGYGDLGCYGATGYETPNLDRMASEGVRFTDFYVAQAVCGASRAALLSGCYPNRISLFGAPGPSSTHGVNQSETLIPEVLKPRGYATAIYGKWHMGHHQKFLPLQHGFDDYFGLPYSNDMWPYHPTAKFPDLPLIDGNRIVNAKVTPEDQTHLTTWYTERAVRFIDQHREQPFFLYVAHAMPHVPLYVSEKFAGKTERGVFGDVISEIDWSVGQILEAIQRNGLDERTLVIFTSDNGPWLSYGNHAGSAGPLREGKGTSWEGGVREPCVMRWPGKIKADSVCTELAATIDLLPTIAGLAGAELPKQPIDGLDIWPLMSGKPGAKTPHDAYYYYWGQELQAVRSGSWKLHFPHAYRSLTGEPGRDGKPGGYSQGRCGLELYNLADDIGESRDVAADHPEVVERLEKLAARMRVELGDSRTKTPGTAIRPAGKL